MQITTNLQQFNHAPALFIVCGTQEAKIYDACDGVIEELDEFRIPKPGFTDHEGFSASGHGAEYTSGAGDEIDQEQRRKEFVKALVEHLKEVATRRPYELVYLFVPQHVHRAVRDAVPHALQPKIAKEIHGNHCEAHPHELIRMVMPEA
ncbi:MAG: host attachment protein [bacterium]|nr:host attachment protein [bacterium]